MADVHIALTKLITEVTGDRDFFIDFQSNYKKRVIAQKLIYFLQSHLGAATRWPFNWYIAGPYSPSLAKELYTISEDLPRITQGASRATLTPSAKVLIQRLQSFVHYDYESLELDLASWVELLASVDYIAKWRKLDLNDERLLEEVLRAKPKFARGQIRRAIGFLQEQG